MTDTPKPPKAAPHEVAEAVDEVCETRDDDSLAEKIESADVAVSVAAGQYRDHPVIRALGFLSEIADQPPAFTLATLAAAGGILAGRPKLAEAGLRTLAALSAATASKAAIKAVVVRTRPFMLLEHGEYETGVMGPNDGPWNSFPSGHTANAVAAARAIARVYPEAAPQLAAGAVAIAAVQVPRAAHHTLDVAAGAALGWACEAAVDRGFALWREGRDD